MENNTNVHTSSKTKICKFYSNGGCKKEENCTFIHEMIIFNENKQNNKKKNRHNNLKGKKNTECFEPMTRSVDLRILYDLDSYSLQQSLTDRDLLLVPNLFKKYEKNEIYNKLVSEIEICNLEKKDLLKLWHGNEKIKGTHYIADDKLKWKYDCPTFDKVLQDIIKYFNVTIKATRFNWYKDSKQWKPFHHDAAAFDPKKSETQNITIAVSFGATRYTALEFSEYNINNMKTTISIPINDGEIYVFTNTTNKLWKHGILQEKDLKNEGRISVIIWGWVDDLKKLNF